MILLEPSYKDDCSWKVNLLAFLAGLDYDQPAEGEGSKQER